MALSKERLGEIAFAVLMAKFEHEGVKVGPDLRRNLGQLAKDTDIKIAELEEFSKEVLVRMLGLAYSENSIRLSFNNQAYCFERKQ